TEAYQSASSSGSVSAGGWGCESTGATSRYVQSVATSVNGQIRVTIATGIDDRLTGQSIYLAPQTNAGAAMQATMIPSQVGQWLCGVTSTQLATVGRFLPGSCKASITVDGSFL
uniref:pilin n=1 Tax=Noviherbaspirillum sp. TaxID=1926288 RepID=UPI002FE2599F